MKKILFFAALMFFVFPLSADFLAGEEAFANKRYSEAMQHFRPLADSGDDRAQYYVGYMYLNGYGVTRNNALGLQYMQKSLDQNYHLAQAYMGFLYHEGQVVPVDYKRSVALYERAADQGNVSASLNLALAYYLGDGVPRNLAKAIELLEKVPVEQQPSAGRYLGDIYLAQDAENMERAIAAYNSAAIEGDLASYVSLAEIYLQGQGVEQDTERGVKYYRYAASQKYAPAQYALGVMYVNGVGVGRDSVLGHAWLTCASNQNYEPAKDALNQLKSEMTLTDLDLARQKYMDIQNTVLGRVVSPIEEERKMLEAERSQTHKQVRRKRR